MKLLPADLCEASSVGPLPLVTALRGPKEPRLKGAVHPPYFPQTLAAALVGCVLLCSCGRGDKVQAKDPGVVASEVGVIKVGRKDLGRSLTLFRREISKPLPFQ